jgi:hypothetical protein
LDVACLGHDLDSLLGVEQHPQARAHHLVVVGEQNCRQARIPLFSVDRSHDS